MAAVAAAEGAQPLDWNVSDLTYGERLSIAWLLLWRGSVISAGIGLATGWLVGFSGLGGGTAIAQWSLVSILAAVLLGLCLIMPWLVRTMLRKRFRGFALVVLRQPRSSSLAHPAESHGSPR
jgi:hypothetical protein